MPAVIDYKQYLIGAAEVYWRAIGSTGPWTYGGATSGDVMFRIRQSRFNAADDINGITEPIMLMDYRSKQGPAECEFNMLEIAGSKLAIPFPGVTATTSSTSTVGGGGSSTTTAATIAGATTVPFTATTNFTVGDYFKIDTGSISEYRRITAIASLNVSFRDPLLYDHASGVAVLETTADGRVEIVPVDLRRLRSTDYNDFVLVGQAPADYYELYLYNAISVTDTVELAFGNDKKAGVKCTIASRKDGSALSSPSWRMRVPA